MSAATPEIVLLIGLFGVLLLDLWTSENNRVITHGLSIVVMLAAAGALALLVALPLLPPLPPEHAASKKAENKVAVKRCFLNII